VKEIKATRRAFFALFGGAVAAGPAAAKTAAQMTMADLSVGKLGLSLGSSMVSGSPAGSINETSQVGWAKDSLKKLAGVSKVERAMRKQEFYFDGLDPQIASLRSISLVNRIRISRDIQFERSEVRQRSYLEGVISGLWS